MLCSTTGLPSITTLKKVATTSRNRRPITEDDKRSPHYLKGVIIATINNHSGKGNVTGGTPDGTGPPETTLVNQWQELSQKRAKNQRRPAAAGT